MKKIVLALMAFTFSYAAQEVVNSKLSGSVDLSTYQEIKKKDTKIVFDKNSSKEGIYNYSYSPNKDAKIAKKNIFLEGNFDAIYRYKSLYFNGDELESDSEDTLKEVMDKIHTYIDDKSREIVVSVLGFTQKTKDNYTEISTGTGYTNFFQSVAQRDDIDPDGASDEAVDFMDIVYEKLVDDNISEEIIYKENRAGKDNLYTEEFSDGRDLNNRVDIAIYVKEVIDHDTDKDGVRDSKDYCPKTPLGAKVDKNGCPLVMSLDLKFDFDKATISDKESLENVKKLSEFMKKYPVYRANIIGHTDSTGRASYNMKLSLRRAEVVKKLIVKDGVYASRLTYEGRGESEPLFENINPLNRHKNRRTEVELTIAVPEKKTSKPRARSRGIGN